MNPALENYWYVACFANQLQNKPLARTILGRPLVLFRENGAPACLLDICPHRNLALSLGRATDQGIQCAYHGWTFNADGKCVRIPAECGSVSGPEAQAFAARESQGLIWVFIGGRKAFEEAGSPEPPRFPFMGEAGWQTWFMERTFRASAFQCIENFLDVPHTVFVHRGLFRTSEGRPTDLEITQTENSVEARFIAERDVDGLVGRLLVPRGSEVTHIDKFIMPSTTRVDYRFSQSRHFVVSSQCTPVSENETRVFTYMAFRFDPVAPLVRLFYAPLARRILDQDVVVLAQQSDNIARFQKSQFYYHATDALAREIKLMMDGTPPPPGITTKRIRA